MSSQSGPIPDGSIRLTIPKVGAGFQAGTFGLLAWIGAQASSAWEELQDSIQATTAATTALVERVGALEGQERADIAARAQASDAQEHSSRTRRELTQRLDVLERCIRNRKNCDLI